MKKKSKPLAVVISDIHYTLNTIEIADAALRAAIIKAANLGVPLIDCGDLTNDKAIIRGEIIKRIMSTIDFAADGGVTILHLVGNHSLINEKSQDHALDFLRTQSTLISYPVEIPHLGGFIPYQNDPEKFYEAIKKFPKKSIVFAHQGALGGAMGDYIRDPSAIDPKKIKDWRVFLGHYHRQYDLENTVSVGNPYTLTFGEAGDGPKGYLIVYEDGSYSREILDYRKHIIMDFDKKNYDFAIGKWKHIPGMNRNPADLIWVKVHGTRSDLLQVSKQKFSEATGIKNFKLDKIVVESEEQAQVKEDLTDSEIFDKVIEGTSESKEQQKYLKGLWREIMT